MKTTLPSVSPLLRILRTTAVLVVAISGAIIATSVFAADSRSSTFSTLFSEVHGRAVATNSGVNAVAFTLGFFRKAPHVAFVRVPSDSPNPVPPGLFDSRMALHGTLDASHQWFATTPIVVELRGGKVVAVVSGSSAMSLQWMNSDKL